MGGVGNITAGSHNNSLSPSRGTLPSSQKKRKQPKITAKKKKEDNILMSSVTNFKPPINCKNLPNLL